MSGESPVPGTVLFGWKADLLHLGVIVADIAIQRETSHLDEWVIAVRPDLRKIEGIEAVGLGRIERHDLHVQRPARELIVLDRLVEVALVVVGIPACDSVGLCLGQTLDTLVALEVVFHPETTAFAIHPHVGVRGVAIHVTPGPRNAPVPHEPGHLMGGLRRQRPEIPLHVGVA